MSLMSYDLMNIDVVYFFLMENIHEKELKAWNI